MVICSLFRRSGSCCSLVFQKCWYQSHRDKWSWQLWKLGLGVAKCCLRSSKLQSVPGNTGFLLLLHYSSVQSKRSGLGKMQRGPKDRTCLKLECSSSPWALLPQLNDTVNRNKPEMCIQLRLPLLLLPSAWSKDSWLSIVCFGNRPGSNWPSTEKIDLLILLLLNRFLIVFEKRLWMTPKWLCYTKGTEM